MSNRSSISHGTSGRIAAVQLGSDSIRVVEIESLRGEVRRLSSAEMPLPNDWWEPSPNGCEAIATAIQTAFTRAGIGSRQVFCCIPRTLTTLKRVRLPYAEPEQLRAMVRFEAQQHIPFAVEDVSLDFLVDSAQDEEMASVWICAARLALVAMILEAFDLAGKQLQAISISTVGLLEHIRTEQTATAIVDVQSSDVDVAVSAAGRLLYSRATTLQPGTGPEQAVDEIVRSLAALRQEHRALAVPTIAVCGQPAMAEAAATMLRDGAGLEAHTLAAPDYGDEFAVCMGIALVAARTGKTPFNLVPVQRFEQRQAARRRVQGLLSVAAVVGLIALVAYGAFRARDADRITALRDQLATHRLTVAQAAVKSMQQQHDAAMAAYTAVSAQMGRSRPAVEVLRVVSQALPADAHTYLGQLSYDRQGTVTLRGTSDKQSGPTDLVISLQKAGYFSSVRLTYVGDVSPSTAGGAAAPRDPSLPRGVTFQVTCDLPVIVAAVPSQLASTRANGQ